MNEVANTLDARGLTCPLPILKTKKAIASISSGEILEVMTTDPGSVKDLDAFCAQTGHQMVSSEQPDGDFVFQIQKL
ncbi:MAG: sulfurtransferase TusA family protein [Gammaproteobacteria bacterium]|nr:sulfurtransferase TusA family protein [Gammaproteobacteria bacterium]